jgi:hypothetical protein
VTRRSTSRWLLGGAAGLLLTLALAQPVAAHDLAGLYESPLPLVVYLAGAGIAVALSFAFVLLRDKPASIPPLGPARVVPAGLRSGLRAVGLVGWTWIVVQAILGGGGDADVSSLFLWVYGWVGLAMISAFIGPAWTWLDPFSTLHDLGAAAIRAVGFRGWEVAAYPRWLGAWPALVGFGFYVWLELIVIGAGGGASLGAILIGYTAITLVAMAQFGRDAWRANGETFSVWFGTLGRLAPWAIDVTDPTAGVRRQPLGAGFTWSPWTVPLVVLVALGTGSIIFDGLSQTQTFFDIFGAPAVGPGTLILAGFLGAIVAVVLLVGRLVGLAALGAGLLPISVGYLVAHYLTYLIGDGQRIIVAISDPFQLGWNLFGTAFFEPSVAWLPTGIVWTVQLAAVVGGHMLGAWAGHEAALATALQEDPDALTRPGAAAELRRRQVPLALLMVGLTVLTLWSLGQNVVKEPASDGLSVGIIDGAGSSLERVETAAERP